MQAGMLAWLSLAIRSLSMLDTEYTIYLEKCTRSLARGVESGMNNILVLAQSIDAY